MTIGRDLLFVLNVKWDADSPDNFRYENMSMSVSAWMKRKIEADAVLC